MLTELPARPEPSGLTECPYLKADDPPSKRRILQTALCLFADQGVETVTVRHIAAEAGYTNPALFKFFPTKDALALYLFESCYLHLFERLKTAIETNSGFGDRIKCILSVFFFELEENLDAFLFVQDHLRHMWPRVAVATRRKSILVLIRRVLQDGIDEGVVGDVSPDMLVAAFTGTLQQFARMLHFREFKGTARDWQQELGTIVRRT